MSKKSGNYEMNVREQLGRIEERLDSMAKRQDDWFELLQGRIPTWDDAAGQAKVVKERGRIWDAGAVKANIIITVLTSAAVLTFVVSAFERLSR